MCRRGQLLKVDVRQGTTLSYEELDNRANQLAHRLVALGVGPEVPVGVMMERSLDLIVALLGVLKAGGAYVPMDPSYPVDRLALMMEDSEARISNRCTVHPNSCSCNSMARPHAKDALLAHAGASDPEPGEGLR